MHHTISALPSPETADITYPLTHTHTITHYPHFSTFEETGVRYIRPEDDQKPKNAAHNLVPISAANAKRTFGGISIVCRTSKLERN